MHRRVARRRRRQQPRRRSPWRRRAGRRTPARRRGRCGSAARIGWSAGSRAGDVLEPRHDLGPQLRAAGRVGVLGQPGGEVDVVVERPAHRGPHLVDDLLEPAHARPARPAVRRSRVDLGERGGEPLGVAPPGVVVAAGGPEPLQAVAADRLERRRSARRRAPASPARASGRRAGRPCRPGGPSARRRAARGRAPDRRTRRSRAARRAGRRRAGARTRPTRSRTVRCRGSTSRRLVGEHVEVVPIDSASSASVIVRSRAAAISSASGRPSTRPTSSATRCRSNVPSSAPGAAAAARWRNSSAAGRLGPGGRQRGERDDVLAVERQRLAARRQDPQPVTAAQEPRHDLGERRRGRARSCRARAGRRSRRRRRAAAAPAAPARRSSAAAIVDATPGRVRRRGPARRRAAPRSCRVATLAGDVDGQARLADAARARRS